MRYDMLQYDTKRFIALQPMVISIWWGWSCCFLDISFRVAETSYEYVIKCKIDKCWLAVNYGRMRHQFCTQIQFLHQSHIFIVSWVQSVMIPICIIKCVFVLFVCCSSMTRMALNEITFTLNLYRLVRWNVLILMDLLCIPANHQIVTKPTLISHTHTTTTTTKKDKYEAQNKFSENRFEWSANKRKQTKNTTKCDYKCHYSYGMMCQNDSLCALGMLDTFFSLIFRRHLCTQGENEFYE